MLATYFVGARGPEYKRNDVNAAVRWYVFDGLGSVVGEVDPNGNLTGTRKHDVYGITRSVTGTVTSKHGYVGNLGHASEDETGLIYMQARYCDPQVGRFVNQDPKQDGDNWLVYCNNNPINYIDATGKNPTSWQLFWNRIAAIAGVIGAGLGFELAIASLSSGAISALAYLGAGLLMAVGEYIAADLALMIIPLLTLPILSALIIGIVICALVVVAATYVAQFDDKDSYVNARTAAYSMRGPALSPSHQKRRPIASPWRFISIGTDQPNSQLAFLTPSHARFHWNVSEKQVIV